MLNVDYEDVVPWLKCYCLQVIGCVGVGLWLECYFLLIIGCAVCCVVIGILLLESLKFVGVIHWLQCAIIIVV